MRTAFVALVLVSLARVRAQPAESPRSPDVEAGAALPDDAAVQEALRTLGAAGEEDDPLGVGDVGTLRDVQVRAPRSERTEALRVPPMVGEVLTAIPGVRETSHRVDVRWVHGLALVREESVLRSSADHVAEARLRLPRPEGAWLVSLEVCVDDRCVAAEPDASTRYDAAWIRAALEPNDAGAAGAPSSSTHRAPPSVTRAPSTTHAERAPSDMRAERAGAIARAASVRTTPVASSTEDAPLFAADAHHDERGPAFSIHVAPLAPGRTHTLRVTWAAPLSVVGGIARLTIPARGNDLRASAARVSFEPGDVLAPTLQGASPEAAVEVDPWTPIAVSGRLASGALRASATSFACGRARCVHVHAAAGSREGAREDVALLIDVSPSSFGPARGRLTPALTSLLAALPGGSEVRAWAFAARAESLVDAPTRPTEIPFAALAGATSHELGSSTRLDVALRALGDARGVHAIVVGDGGLTEGPHLDAAIAEAARRGQRLSVLSLVERPVHPRLVSAVERLGGRVLVVPSALFEGAAAASLDGHVATLFAPSLGHVQLGRADLGELRAGAALAHTDSWSRGARVRVGRLEVPVRETSDVGLRAALAALGRAHAGEPTRLALAPEIEPARSCAELTRATSAPSSRVDPWMSTDTRSCALPTAPPPTPSSLGRGIPAETVLSMLRRRVVPVARGCFRRDRAGREDYATRAVFELRLTDREVAASDVVGEIDDELRECLMHAVDGLEVPAYDGTIVVRYPLYTRAHGPSLTIELHPDVASVVDRVLPSDAPPRPVP
ncbi:MAG: VWA domain-containing protein [Myxococcota bacterium]|nr:VWA domain-containing protein [Myxococcota bacterium]